MRQDCEPDAPGGPDDPDSAVIARSLGEPQAFARIFDRHAAPVMRYLVRRVGPDIAESLLGEVFRIAFEQRQRFDTTRSNAGPWLYGIASNLLLKHRRGEARRLRATAALASGLAEAAPDEDDLVDALDARDLLPRIAEAIGALPEGEREALLLYAWEDLGYAEIAETLEIPVGTVRSRLNRARVKLRELVARRELAGPRGKGKGEPEQPESGRRRP